MERVFNFSAGPAMMAQSVLEKAAAELVCYKDKGMSVMEMSHRSAMYIDILTETKVLLKQLMQIPDDYDILFLQGGATLQFSAVPLNLMQTGKADYVDSGNFAHLAAEEAKKYGQVHVAGSTREEGYTHIPDSIDLSPDADYVYITTNNTIYGTRYTALPDTGSVPLAADMSSNILSQPTDVSRFGVIFAGAQKNIGPAGLCIVIVRKDLLGHAAPQCPKLMDQSRLFKPTARRDARSLMNVTFVTGDADKDAAFVKYAAANGLVNLKGHRSVGGMRASIYNAMPVEGVEKLIAVMKAFEKENV